MAEGEGFEPSVQLPAQQFSRLSSSTTPAPFRDHRILPPISGLTRVPAGAKYHNLENHPLRKLGK